MSTIFIDGFDKYGPTNEHSPLVTTLVTQGAWNAVGAGNVAIAASLNTIGGYSLATNGGSNQWVSRTLGANYSRLIGGFRFSTTGSVGTAQTFLFKFMDVSSVQCSVLMNTDGTFSVENGDYGGTVLATSGVAITATSTHYLEFDIAFGASASFTIYLDGISILTASSKNTKTTANSYANVFVLGNTTGFAGSGACIYDDFYLFDTSGSTNNAALLTNPVVRTDFPNSDSQTQFTNVGNLLGTNYSASLEVAATAANTLTLRKYVAPVGCTLRSISFTPATTNGTIHFKPAVYADAAGAPGSLLSGGSAITGCTANTMITAPLTTPQTLTASAAYWIGWLTDDSVSYTQTEGIATSTSGYTASSTYASGVPGTAPVMTANQPSFNVFGNCTGAATNNASMNQNPAPGDASSIDSSTSGNEDLYGFAALPLAITNIYTVGVKAHARLSDTGARTVDLRMKSSSTDSGGSHTGQSPGMTYQWLESYFETDPNTSSAWTTTNLNAATAGIKVAS